jgi:hypothetical protein
MTARRPFLFPTGRIAMSGLVALAVEVVLLPVVTLVVVDLVARDISSMV